MSIEKTKALMELFRKQSQFNNLRSANIILVNILDAQIEILENFEQRLAKIEKTHITRRTITAPAARAYDIETAADADLAQVAALAGLLVDQTVDEPASADVADEPPKGTNKSRRSRKKTD